MQRKLTTRSATVSPAAPTTANFICMGEQRNLGSTNLVQGDVSTTPRPVGRVYDAKAGWACLERQGRRAWRLGTSTKG